MEEGTQDRNGSFPFPLDHLIQRLKPVSLLQYYLRTRAAVGAIKFTVDQATLSTLFASPLSLSPFSQTNPFAFSHPDQAKADNKKPSPVASVPKPIVAAAPAPAPVAPVSAIRDITNSLAQTTIAPAPAPVAAPAPKKVDESVPAAPFAAASSSSLSATAPVVEGEITYEEAVKRREANELEQAKLQCSLENKEAVSFFFFGFWRERVLEGLVLIFLVLLR